MANIFWSNVGIDVQSALATALTITAITKANPGVVSYTGTDPANGDYVVMSVVGMFQVNSRVFRVANVNAGGNTFELEGEDTSAYDTFTSGTCQVITFGYSMTTVQGINASGGEPQFADLTVVHENVERRAPVRTSPMSMTMESLYSSTDTAILALRSAARALTTRAIKFRFADGTKMVFTAYISAAAIPTGAAGEAVKENLGFEAQGLPTVYST